MEKQDLENMMDKMNIPKVEIPEYQKEFRTRLLSTKKSAMIGVLLLITPFLFLVGVIFKHYLQIDLGILTALYEYIASLDAKYGDDSIINWVFRFLLLGGPLVAVLYNLFAIVHVRYEKNLKEVIIGIKIKWVNISIILICKIIFFIFVLYLIIENTSQA